MKSLFFPTVFSFCFVIMLAGTKAVPTGETPSICRSKIRFAMAVRFRPQLVRKSQCTLLIGILFLTLDWQQISSCASDSTSVFLSEPNERSPYVGLRIHWSNPCRFNSCRPHQMKTKASDIRKNRRFFICT